MLAYRIFFFFPFIPPSFLPFYPSFFRLVDLCGLIASVVYLTVPLCVGSLEAMGPHDNAFGNRSDPVVHAPGRCAPGDTSLPPISVDDANPAPLEALDPEQDGLAFPGPFFPHPTSCVRVNSLSSIVLCPRTFDFPFSKHLDDPEFSNHNRTGP